MVSLSLTWTYLAHFLSCCCWLWTSKYWLGKWNDLSEFACKLLKVLNFPKLELIQENSRILACFHHKYLDKYLKSLTHVHLIFRTSALLWAEYLCCIFNLGRGHWYTLSSSSFAFKSSEPLDSMSFQEKVSGKFFSKHTLWNLTL